MTESGSDANAALFTALSDRYSVERELGSGGMATVYLAQDLRHGRQVAVKVLHEHLAAAVGTDRFLTEIRTTAKLHHAHVLPLFDSGEAAGRLFYVMPFVDGNTLRDRLNRERSLTIDEAIRLAAEIADALAYAHAQGIVHRDIKPENILLSSGHAYVADFGIARAASVASEHRMTQTGVALGTPAYMSPEQIFAEKEIDGRADIYSLGCVLFEMLAGESPFRAVSDASFLVKRMTQPAPSVVTKRIDTPAWLSDVVRQAMAQEPIDRFQTAGALMHSLTVTHSSRVASTSAARCIAVLPFANMSADSDAEYFSDGMTEELLNMLVTLPGLRVIARTSSFAFKGKFVDVREIGERLGAGLVLEGSVRKSGNRVRIVAQLIDAATGHHLWSDRYDRALDDVFTIQDEITAAIRDALSGVLSPQLPPQKRVAPQIEPAAYELFLRAKFQFARIDGMHKGLEYLQQVRTMAPTFAPACSELAFATLLLSWYCVLPADVGFPRARGLAEEALALDPNSARAEFVLGQVALYCDRDWVKAAKHSDRSLLCDPSDALAHIGRCYIHVSLGEFAKARRLQTIATTLDPLNPSIHSWSSMLSWMARDLDHVLKTSNDALELDPNHLQALRFKGQALAATGHFEEGVKLLRSAIAISGRDVMSLNILSIMLAQEGQVEEAEQLLAEQIEAQRSAAVPYVFAAYVLGALNRKDEAFDWLQRGVAKHDYWLSMMRVEPWYDSLRSDPRFDAVMEALGIPELSKAQSMT